MTLSGSRDPTSEYHRLVAALLHDIYFSYRCGVLSHCARTIPLATGAAADPVVFVLYQSGSSRAARNNQGPAPYDHLDILPSSRLGHGPRCDCHYPWAAPVQDLEASLSVSSLVHAL